MSTCPELLQRCAELICMRCRWAVACALPKYVLLAPSYQAAHSSGLLKLPCAASYEPGHQSEVQNAVITGLTSWQRIKQHCTTHSVLQLLPWTTRAVAWAATLDPASPWDAGTMGTVSTLANVATMLTGFRLKLALQRCRAPCVQHCLCM